MTKEALKKMIKDLKLDADLDLMFNEMIDEASVIDQEFLNTIADILEIHAGFHEHAADLLEAEAEDLEKLESAIMQEQSDEYRAELAVLKEKNAKLVQEGKNIRETISLQRSQKVQDIQGINDARQTIKSVEDVDEKADTSISATAVQTGQAPTSAPTATLPTENNAPGSI